MHSNGLIFMRKSHVYAQKSRNRYIPVRCIVSDKITKAHQLRLAYDALVLGNVTGQMPGSGKIIYGIRKAVMRIKLNELIPIVEILVQNMRATLASSTPPTLALIEHCTECQFEARCRNKAASDDDLSLLRGMSAKERMKLRHRGIFTITQL